MDSTAIIGILSRAVPATGLGEGVAGLVTDVGDGADGPGDASDGVAVGLRSVGAELPGEAEVALGVARPAGMAQPATSETIRAMAKVRTSNRCRRQANSQRRAR